ncbi:MAG: tRNA (adenosine(37)-N6)-threonylcarbamoyltransferase complex dimerization subunit type 1 TsaB, partial [Candidatus Latescibacteria bacterium]|nr:tRNA (adenosine(37)-N6)-threonylcarbamoyltransferase complex dimerization subunit type 1 TsaB [Candidatus Latescibacterota bacterium]
MLILGIETSTPVCSIALVEDNTVCAQYTLELGIHHSEHLFPMIQRILSDRGVVASDLDGVSVASGPGSFTGLRIGMASAKSLCMSADVPLVGVSTLAG